MIKSAILPLALFLVANSSFAQSKEVPENEANCKNISGHYERFVLEIADAIQVPVNSIKVIGSTWNRYSSIQCKMMISTPRGNMECASGSIYTSANGKNLMAAGTGYGNRSCSKIN